MTPPMFALTDSQWVQVALLVTTVGGFIGQAWREHRNRLWAQQDRANATREIVAVAKAEAEATRIRHESAIESLKLEAIAAAETLRVETSRTASVVAQRAAAQMATLHTTLVEVQQDARAAYKEANDVNLKIAGLGERLVAVQDTATAAAVDQVHGIADVQETSTDVRDRVKDIQETLDTKGRA